MSDIFSEKNMMYALERYLPAGETVVAGIHGIGLESDIRQVFGKCFLVEDTLIPKENGITIEVRKRKHANCDLYIGITRNYLILAECDVYQHLYEFNDSPNLAGAQVQELGAPLSIKDIGTCFPLDEIRTCEIRKGWMGSVKCFITMKNGSLLKLMLPKLGGVGGGMPHHKEYREMIISRLGG